MRETQLTHGVEVDSCGFRRVSPVVKDEGSAVHAGVFRGQRVVDDLAPQPPVQESRWPTISRRGDSQQHIRQSVSWLRVFSYVMLDAVFTVGVGLEECQVVDATYGACVAVGLVGAL